MLAVVLLTDSKVCKARHELSKSQVALVEKDL